MDDSLYLYFREYNELNQLIRIRQGNLSTSPVLEEFTWAPAEERVLVKDIFTAGVKTSTIYYVSKEYLVVENSTGNYTEKYVYQGNDLVAQVTTDNLKQAVHNDNKGSNTLITDSTGAVVENNFYSPFGEQLTTTTSRFTYESKELDPLTKALDFHARQFNPSIGKFSQPDEKLQNYYNPQLLNRYSFEKNNPYKHIDPTGKSIEGFLDGTIQLGLGIVGAVAGIGIATATGVTVVGAVGGAALFTSGLLAASLGFAKVVGSFTNDLQTDKKFSDSVDLSKNLGAVSGTIATSLTGKDPIKDTKNTKLGSTLDDLLGTGLDIVKDPTPKNIIKNLVLYYFGTISFVDYSLSKQQNDKKSQGSGSTRSDYWSNVDCKDMCTSSCDLHGKCSKSCTTRCTVRSG